MTKKNNVMELLNWLQKTHDYHDHTSASAYVAGVAIEIANRDPTLNAKFGWHLDRLKQEKRNEDANKKTDV